MFRHRSHMLFREDDLLICRGSEIRERLVVASRVESEWNILVRVAVDEKDAS